MKHCTHKPFIVIKGAQVVKKQIVTRPNGPVFTMNVELTIGSMLEEDVEIRR